MFYRSCQHLGIRCRALGTPCTFHSLGYKILNHVGVARSNVPLRGCRYIHSTVPLSSDTDKNNLPKEQQRKLTTSEKFTKFYKEYGATLIVVHATTSFLWFGTFYLIVISGVDLVPLLAKLNISEEKQARFLSAGDLIAAAILTTLARPVRYMTSLALTRQIVIYLRKIGYLPPAKT